MTISTLPLVAAPLYGEAPWYAAKSAAGDVLWCSSPELPDASFSWALDADVTTAHATLDLTAVAELLWCSSLQPGTWPTPSEVQMALTAQLANCRCDLTPCLLRLATEAGDHPFETAARMRWCLALAELVLNPFRPEVS